MVTDLDSRGSVRIARLLDSEPDIEPLNGVPHLQPLRKRVPASVQHLVTVLVEEGNGLRGEFGARDMGKGAILGEIS